MCFCERFQPPSVRCLRSRFPGNLGVVCETDGVSSHRELNQTFVRATLTSAFSRDPRARRDSGEVWSEVHHAETAPPNSESELH